MNWPRKYRPHRFADLHLTNVRDQCLSYLKNGHFPQVLLFAGPKGTGKTTTARLIAACVNEPSNLDQVKHSYFGISKPKYKPVPLNEPSASTETDLILNGQSALIVEMDAASNRGIDDVRNIRESLYNPPATALMAVYILDEAHMMTTQAFNALLKILEEPPRHAIFILATTELSSIPSTVQSRCQIMQFRLATAPELKEALERVAKGESIETQPADLAQIALMADGSFRDAIKLLEHSVVKGRVNLEQLQLPALANLRQETMELLGHLIKRQAEPLKVIINQWRSQGVTEKLVVHQVYSLLAEALNQASQVPDLTLDKALFLLNHFKQSQIEKALPIPMLSLELACLQLLFRTAKKPAAPPQATGSKVESPNSSEPASPAAQVSTSAELKPVVAGTKLKIVWDQVVDHVSQHNLTLGSMLRSAQLEVISDSIVQLIVFYQFHREQLVAPKHRQCIDQVIENLLGGTVIWEVVTQPMPATAELVEPLSLQEIKSSLDL